MEPAPQRLSATELQQQWWTWAASTPSRTNPVVDKTGRHCEQGQPEGIWFLGGTFGDRVHRKCRMPAGLPLAGPVLTLITPDAAYCSTYVDDARGEAILDGEGIPVDRIGPLRIVYTAQPDNPITYLTGPLESYACGLWVQIRPLTAGKHTLVLRGRSGDFSTEANYELTVLADHPEALRMPPLPAPRERSRR